jgi:VanZ family protein
MKYWIPVALMMSLMYLFSTDLFSSEHTARIIEWIMKLFKDDAGGPDLGETNFAVRKFAHFFEYAVLAVLLFRALRAGDGRRWKISWAAFAFFILAIWSLLDEFHQTFTKTRGGSVYDSMIDSSGGLFALLLITLYCRLKARKQTRA